MIRYTYDERGERTGYEYVEPERRGQGMANGAHYYRYKDDRTVQYEEEEETSWTKSSAMKVADAKAKGSSTPSSIFLAASDSFIARSSATTALAFSLNAFLLFRAWIALSVLETCFTLGLGTMLKHCFIMEEIKA